MEVFVHGWLGRVDLSGWAELAAVTARAAKKRAQMEKAAGKKRRELERKAAKAGKGAKRKVGIEPRPRRWPWLLAVLGIAGLSWTEARDLMDQHPDLEAQ